MPLLNPIMETPTPKKRVGPKSNKLIKDVYMPHVLDSFKRSSYYVHTVKCLVQIQVKLNDLKLFHFQH